MTPDTTNYDRIFFALEAIATELSITNEYLDRMTSALERLRRGNDNG